MKLHPLFIDGFAGGGGASTGIGQALRREVDIAINHSETAIAIHKANHPDTEHHCTDIRMPLLPKSLVRSWRRRSMEADRPPLPVPPERGDSIGGPLQGMVDPGQREDADPTGRG